MKRFLLLILMGLLIAGCSKQEVADVEPVDIWNGYDNYKYSTMTVDLVTKTRRGGGMEMPQ